MGHSIHFRDAAGDAQLEDAGTLQAALERVERLRNDGGATEIRVFREVPIQVRTYYRAVAVDVDAQEEAAADLPAAATGPHEPVGALEPPSGAMVMSPPPVPAVGSPRAGEEPGAETNAGEPRRARFGRN